MNNRQYLPKGLLIVSFILCIVSCKKFNDPPLYFEDYGDDSSALQTRKVIVIGVDGFSGVDLQNSTHPQIDSLLQHSKYSYSLLNEVNNNDVASWESIMTSIPVNAHNVVDSSFSPQGDFYDPDETVTTYNGLFFYLIKYKPSAQTISITPWSNLSNSLFKGSTQKIIVNDDAAVTDSAVKALSTSKADVTLLNYNGIAKAGVANGFNVSSAAYKTAITSLDANIGKVIAAIKSRTDYAKENWLIVLTSNRGPSQANPNPGFVIYSNTKLKKEEVKKNGESAPYISYNGSTTNNAYVIPDDKGIYNLSNNQDFTIQFSLNVASNSAITFPFLLSKKAYVNAGSSAKGWVFYLGYDLGWSMDFGAKRSSGYRLGGTPYTNTINMRDATWYTITVAVRNIDGHRYLKAYTYSSSKDTLDVAVEKLIPDALGDFSTDAPLTIGHIYNAQSGEGGASYFDIRNVAIFNKALDSATIKQTTCLQDYLKHPQAANLIGYWPCDESGGFIFNNKVDAYKDMFFAQNGAFNPWVVLDRTKLPCFIPNSGDLTKNYSIVPGNEDIVPNILTWLRVTIDAKWGLTGKNWIQTFDREYVIGE